MQKWFFILIEWSIDHYLYRDLRFIWSFNIPTYESASGLRDLTDISVEYSYSQYKFLSHFVREHIWCQGVLIFFDVLEAWLEDYKWHSIDEIYKTLHLKLILVRFTFDLSNKFAHCPNCHYQSEKEIQYCQIEVVPLQLVLNWNQ